ncbi:MAG: helix-turn-helix domain-containing protein [Solirubrobacteraceae bacterium]
MRRRAYLLERRPAGEIAEAFGYTVETLNSIVRDFRAGRREFFVSSRPGPKRAGEGAGACPDR